MFEFGKLISSPSVQERLEFSVRPWDSSASVPSLNALALRSLVRLFDEKEKLFFQRACLSGGEFRAQAISRKKSVVALLGLQNLARTGAALPLDISSIRGAIVTDPRCVESLGELGLLIWLAAEFEPERLERLFREFNLGEAIENYADGRQGRTESLAWFLSGVSRAWLAAPASVSDLMDVAVDAYHLLQDNQGSSGIIGHASSARFPFGVFHQRFGTFADQMHAIHALTMFARAFHIDEPLASALACANAIRALQGEMGQWWSLYDRATGRIVNHYPVYSQNQGGLAPLGFMSLREATGQDFSGAVDKGLSWIAGENELGADLRSGERGVIWDSIGPGKGTVNYWEAVANLMGGSRAHRTENLLIRYEVQPDHFGWMLYALGSAGLPKDATARQQTRKLAARATHA